MAERRMVSKKIVDTDLFLDMPATTRLLYYDLLVRADDDGFVGSPKKITKMVGASDDDLRILISKQFLIPFESGVCVIKDWKIHNYIRADRRHETQYIDEKSQLTTTKSGSYALCHTDCLPNDIPNDNQMTDSCPTEVRLGKDRVGKSKESIEKAPDEPTPNSPSDETITPEEYHANQEATEKKRFHPPTVGEVTDYCRERNNKIDPEQFVDFYAARGWMLGKTKMKDWHAAVRTWERRDDGDGKRKDDQTPWL